MDALSSLFKDFDIGKYLPEMETLLDKVDLFCRISVLAVPALLFLLGLKFLVWPAKGPKGLGYRNFYVTGSVRAWQYTQRFAGICWTAVGAVLLIGALILFKKFPEKEQLDVFRSCIIYLIVELVVLLLSRWGINIRTMIAFDIKGKMRPKYKEKLIAANKKKAEEKAKRKKAAKPKQDLVINVNPHTPATPVAPAVPTPVAPVAPAAPTQFDLPVDLAPAEAVAEPAPVVEPTPAAEEVVAEVVTPPVVQRRYPTMADLETDPTIEIKNEPVAVAEPEVVAEPTVEITPEPEAVPAPAEEVKAEPLWDPDATMEIKNEPELTIVVEAQPEPTPTPSAEAKTEPLWDPDATIEIKNEDFSL